MKLENLLKLSYNEYAVYLKAKYGKVPANYCYKTKNGTYLINSKQISRTNDGLMIHHILEDQYLYLANNNTINEIMNSHPETQDADNLVYCDYLEHLLLHIKITEELDTANFIYGWGGIFSIVKHINSAYQYYYIEGDVDYSLVSAHGSYRKHCSEKIIGELNTYLQIIDYLMNNVLNDVIYNSDGHLEVSELWATYCGEFVIAKERIKKNGNYTVLVDTQRRLKNNSVYSSLNEVYQANL